MGLSVGLCWAGFLTELLFLPVMLGWRCPSSSCTRSLMTVSCVWDATENQWGEGTSGSGGRWRKQFWWSCPSAKGPALPL